MSTDPKNELGQLFANNLNLVKRALLKIPSVNFSLFNEDHITALKIIHKDVLVGMSTYLREKGNIFYLFSEKFGGQRGSLFLTHLSEDTPYWMYTLGKNLPECYDLSCVKLFIYIQLFSDIFSCVEIPLIHSPSSTKIRIVPNVAYRSLRGSTSPENTFPEKKYDQTPFQVKFPKKIQCPWTGLFPRNCEIFFSIFTANPSGGCSDCTDLLPEWGEDESFLWVSDKKLSSSPHTGKRSIYGGVEKSFSIQSKRSVKNKALKRQRTVHPQYDPKLFQIHYTNCSTPTQQLAPTSVSPFMKLDDNSYFDTVCGTARTAPIDIYTPISSTVSSTPVTAIPTQIISTQRNYTPKDYDFFEKHFREKIEDEISQRYASEIEHYTHLIEKLTLALNDTIK